MQNEKLKAIVAEAAARFGADAYEIRISTTESAGAEALKDEISTVTYALSGGMTVRCVKNGRSGYAASELISEEAAAELVRQACANAEAIDEEDAVPLFEGSDAYESREGEAKALPSAEELKAQTLQLQKLTYEASDRIVDGTQCQVKGIFVRDSFLNSAGVDLSYECSRVIRVVAAAVREGDQADDDYSVVPVAKETPEETVNKTVQSALGKLGADTVDSGKYDIIFDKDSLRSLLETYASVFSARSAYLKTTLLAGKEGEEVAAPCVTLVDDPFWADKFGHCPYDGEGVAVRTKKLIENGVLKTLLYNRMYARLLGRETTGNAAGARNIEPKGLYIAPGAYSEQALLEHMGSGLYITALNGLHAGANTQSGDFSLQAEGWLVEGGKKVRPVKNITVADNFFRILKKVDAIGDTVEFDAVSDFGAPELLVKDVSVSGR